MRLTLSPRASSRQPMEAAARPLPSEDTTPPVTKMYFADMSATSLDELEVCAWCARLSIAGLGCGGNGLTFGGNPRRNRLGFCTTDRAVWVRIFAVYLWIFYGFLMENGVFLYGKDGVLDSLCLVRAYERREFEEECVSGCGVAGCSCAVRS